MIDKEEILFPYPEVREIQSDMIKEVMECIENGENALIHAPTGLGKTVASLGPALSVAMKKGLTIFFLTSRHTQHVLAINTLRDIKKKHGVSVVCADIIGKQHMCALGEVENLYSSEFRDYCKKMRDDKMCEFYINTKNTSGRPTLKALSILEELKHLSPMHVEEVVSIASKEKLCPYEMSLLLAKEAKVIVADYYCIFNPEIRRSFMNKTEKELETSIVIVDEAHNLPRRCRELMSQNLSTVMLKRAIKEAGKFGHFEAMDKLQGMNNFLEKLTLTIEEFKDEKLITKKEFMALPNYDDLAGEFALIGDEVREKQKKSYIASIAVFLDKWSGEDRGFARILQRKGDVANLIYKCLDPSFISKEVVDNARSVICMSGTLTPTYMYKDILGFENAREMVFKSPFPSNNRLSLIIPETTTRYSKRGAGEFEKIAAVCSNIVNLVPGNSMVFFPSYDLRDKVYAFLKCNKEIMVEKPRLTKEEKNEMLNEFKKRKDKGACLLAVTSGSFGEGVDLPGDFLKCVVVVGLPLEKPSLEVRELIDYYDAKYGKGWEYAYLIPAMIMIMQNAGRCIRSETDRGVIAFLDERYSWEQYYKCFPPDHKVKISKLYLEKIKGFFD